ncbi:MAG: prolyl oligopeptidase family serine peptidase [bacterium]|nr:prolyl oligopeptidase family serine peptidase [bacterium]
MSKERTTWRSERLGRDISLVRWGEEGAPVLFFPTAAADAEEVERFKLVHVLGEMLEARRIKLYSIDSVAGQAWLKEDNSSGVAAAVQNRFDAAIYHEVVPAIRKDCNDDSIEVIATGPSIGAFNALAVTTRHPDVFRAAICMSGTYDLSKFIEGEVTDDYYHSSPLHFLPGLSPDGDHVKSLRERFVVLAHGEGNYEDPAESWKVETVLGRLSIPNRVDSWGPEYHHDWPTWREMLPKYLDEVLG